MSALREAFRSGRGPREAPSIDTQGDKGTPGEGTFEVGATWVRKVLSPEVDRANFELEPEKVALRLDVNLDPRSTNPAHADLWFCELGEGHRRTGDKYSLNVVDRKVWLYKTGAPGRVLGNIGDCGSDVIEALMREAAKEFGTQVR